jgi:hypothetical protein
MRLRQDQIDKLARHSFHNQILRSLEQILPDQVRPYTTTELLVGFEDAHQIALGYGITTQRAILQFVIIGILAGQEFHNRPAMHKFLCSPGMSGNEKMHLLTNLITNEARRGKT